MEYSGVPSRVEPLETAGQIFRHWIKDEAALRAILSAGILKAGPTAYVEFTGDHRAYIKQIYNDLHGVFFTTPAHSASEPRVMNSSAQYYIDFQIPSGIAALRLDGDEVLMIPALPGTPIPVKIVGSSPLS
jgi:hypothetical protein